MGQINVPEDWRLASATKVEERTRWFNELRLVLILAIVLVYTGDRITIRR